MDLALPSPHDPFVSRLRRTLRERRLIRPGEPILVACSGGADSTALLVALAALDPADRPRLAVGHVNHGIRGEEADADARFASDLARELGLPFHVGWADVPAIRGKRGGSVEEVARWARIALLRDMAAAAGSARIATAHHRDDQAETLLLHLLRGSGLDGIAGMAWSEAGFVRPFLDVGRMEIRDALRRWDVPWREDRSNASLGHARNRLRHGLLPVLAAEWNPRIVDALARLAETAAEDSAALDAWVDRCWREIARRADAEVVVLDRSRAAEYPLGIGRRLVRRATERLRTVAAPLSYAETERIARLLGERGEVVLRGKLVAWSDGDAVRIEAADAWRGPTAVAVPGRTVVPGRGVLVAECVGEDPVGADFVWPAEAIAGEPFVRRWRPGDRIAIRHGERPRLVADVARERRPPIDPRDVVVLADAERIVWAIGIATAEPPESARDPGRMAFWWKTKTDG